MSAFVIEAVERTEHGKNASRRLRAAGKIPGVVYGHGFGNLSVAVDPKEVVEILTSESGRNTIFTLKVNDRTADVLIRDYQLHPVRGTLLHADFQNIAMDEVREFEIPVEVVGTAKGVKTGGILDHVLRAVTVECLPRDVPEGFPVDVSELDVGDMLRVSDLNLVSDRYTLLSDPEQVVVTVVAPRVEEEKEEVELGLEEEAEPELIRRTKAEEEAEEEE